MTRTEPSGIPNILGQVVPQRVRRYGWKIPVREPDRLNGSYSRRRIRAGRLKMGTPSDTVMHHAAAGDGTSANGEGRIRVTDPPKRRRDLGRSLPSPVRRARAIRRPSASKRVRDRGQLLVVDDDVVEGGVRGPSGPSATTAATSLADVAHAIGYERPPGDALRPHLRPTCQTSRDGPEPSLEHVASAVKHEAGRRDAPRAAQIALVPRMRAWAYGLRRNARCVIPSRARSFTYWPRPAASCRLLRPGTRRPMRPCGGTTSSWTSGGGRDRHAAARASVGPSWP